MFSKNTIQRSLNAHSAIGLTVGAILYLICLSGTITVLEHEIERWQQPGIQEFNNMSASNIAIAANTFINETNSKPESLYVVLPTIDLPRAHVSDKETEWYVAQDGARLAAPTQGFLHFLVELHANLHMGETVGVIIVSCFGAMLLALIISGIIAHPKIFKDAFRLKLGGQKRLEQVDIHNRLSVWGLPFHLVMGITGAYFGLVGIMATIAAVFYFDGDREQLVKTVYGKDPIVTSEIIEHIPEESVSKALSYINSLNNDKKPEKVIPIYLVFQNIGTDKYFFEVAATHSNRLIYSEIYRFYSNGDYINHQELSDGPIGRQIAYSVYRLHFGQFDGILIKVIYFILGLALTIVCVTGINIWLEKSQQSERVRSMWIGLVWGIPIGLTITALLSIIFNIAALIDFLLAIALTTATTAFINNEQKAKIATKLFLSGLLVSLAASHYFIYQNKSLMGAALWINILLILIGVLLALPIKSKIKTLKPQNHTLEPKSP